jgi:hypothetical protein
MTSTDHGARGPAIGYYYQAIYALIQLFSSTKNDAFVSIETLDDVYHEDGATKTLIQLKHSIKENTKISIKSVQLWKTIKVWCDFLSIDSSSDGLFVLSTVATLTKGSKLELLKKKDNERNLLIESLVEESQRVITEREKQKKENINRLTKSKPEKNLPYEDRYKGCESFLQLSVSERLRFVNNITLTTGTFTLDDANKEVIKYIRTNTPSNYHSDLAESIIAWWDREAVKSLTRERSEAIYFSELQEFIARKNAELYKDGFTDDLEDMPLPKLTAPNEIQQQQLNIISATKAQIRRSYNTEMKARIQRNIWMRRSLPASKKLEQYDEGLVTEWSYPFEDIEELHSKSDSLTKEEEGRKLLDWTHQDAHHQVKAISPNYSNPDLIRGSYQILSAQKRVGWHCDFKKLIK